MKEEGGDGLRGREEKKRREGRKGGDETRGKDERRGEGKERYEKSKRKRREVENGKGGKTADMEAAKGEGRKGCCRDIRRGKS